MKLDSARELKQSLMRSMLSPAEVTARIRAVGVARRPAESAIDHRGVALGGQPAPEVRLCSRCKGSTSGIREQRLRTEKFERRPAGEIDLVYVGPRCQARGSRATRRKPSTTDRMFGWPLQDHGRELSVCIVRNDRGDVMIHVPTITFWPMRTGPGKAIQYCSLELLTEAGAPAVLWPVESVYEVKKAWCQSCGLRNRSRQQWHRF